MTAHRSPLYFRTVGSQENHVQGALLIESGVVPNKFFYSIYKYLPKYICRIISTIKKTNIGGTQLPDKASRPHAIMHVPLDCYLRAGAAT
jgi:hypothetical protein